MTDPRQNMINRILHNDDDDEDIQWITTETGTHVPLKNGKAVGGAMKGQDFSDAKSESSSSTNKKSVGKNSSAKSSKTPSKTKSQKARRFVGNVEVVSSSKSLGKENKGRKYSFVRKAINEVLSGYYDDEHEADVKRASKKINSALSVGDIFGFDDFYYKKIGDDTYRPISTYDDDETILESFGHEMSFEDISDLYEAYSEFLNVEDADYPDIEVYDSNGEIEGKLKTPDGNDFSVTDVSVLNFEDKKSKMLQDKLYNCCRGGDVVDTDEIDKELSVGDVIQIDNMLYRKVGDNEYISSERSDFPDLEDSMDDIDYSIDDKVYMDWNCLHYGKKYGLENVFQTSPAPKEGMGDFVDTVLALSDQYNDNASKIKSAIKEKYKVYSV